MKAGDKIVCLLSGGMDSTTLLYHCLDAGYEPHALSVHYGQRHSRELDAAERIALDSAKVPWHQVDLEDFSLWGMQGSSQTSKDMEVPDGHYSAETMRQTVVPNRNMLMLALAGAWAVTLKAQAVAYAAHAGDHYIYPDCRPEFIHAMKDAFLAMSDKAVGLFTPFMHWTKADIALHGSILNVPYELTYSCYKGRPIHCGSCGTCNERREAFILSAVTDPTEYERTDPIPAPPVHA